MLVMVVNIGKNHVHYIPELKLSSLTVYIRLVAQAVANPVKTALVINAWSAVKRCSASAPLD